MSYWLNHFRCIVNLEFDILFFLNEIYYWSINNTLYYSQNNETQQLTTNDIDTSTCIHTNGPNSCLLKKRKKDNINRNNILVLYLSQIPGISTSVGETINNQFKTMNNLITFLNTFETNEKKIEYLSNIEVNIKNNKTRRIGNKIASRIIELLF